MPEIDDRMPIVGVGASAGGLEALRQMFGGFKDRTGMAFVVVQHLDPTHESLMAQLIERYTAMAVKQAEGGEKLEPDHVYVIPPGHGLAVEDGVLNLTEFTDPRGMRRPIDDFFESLAVERAERAACVILSGTGADGCRGLRAIKEFGGICIVQDPASAAYDGMPASAIGTGLVDIVNEPGDIIGSLSNFFERGALSKGTFEDTREVADTIDQICAVLQQSVGHDFSEYKRSTLGRRIARRMQVLGIEQGDVYLDRLNHDATECEALFRDLLINVTRFFRDKDHFEALNTLVIDPLVAKARDGEEIRVWVPGCSSGEEAYTIAMLFAAAKQRHGRRPYVQIFATDIDDRMLDIARTASYPVSALSDIPQNMRDRFIVGGPDKFVISPLLRDMVRFSVHNIVRDPPYSKIDLISCRNLLIYFEESLQQTVVPLFHFSLAPGGRLFLGSSEAIGRFDDLFEPVDQSSRLFKRRDVKSKYSLKLGNSAGAHMRRRQLNTPEQQPRFENHVEMQALAVLAKRYSPVSMLVDHEGTLLERWGSVGKYLEFPDRAERTVHVPSLARPGLRPVIGPLLRKAAETGKRAGASDVEIATEFGSVPARVVCEPIEDSAFLIIIEQIGELRAEDTFDDFDLEEGQQSFLEEELQATRVRLRTTVEELETANEELKSSNEEMMSMNEELQSTNEELTTVNDELKNKVDQLTTANSDLRNFFDSTQLAVLVIDEDMKLRSFTEAAQNIFTIDTHYVGRSLTDLPHLLSDSSFIELARSAADDGKQLEGTFHSPSLEAEFILRAIPYRRLDGSIDGATLVFTDVTQAVSLERNLRAERQRLRLALEVANIGVWEYEPSTDKTVLDATERKLLGLADDDPGDTMEPILAALSGEDRDRVNKSLRLAMDGEKDFDETFSLPLGDGQERWLRGLGKLIETLGQRKFVGVTFDITAERALLDQRELMIREMNHRVKNLFSVIAAMVNIAARGAADVPEFAQELRDRIYALGRSHSLTNSSADGAGGGVSLKDLIETVIAPNRSEQQVELIGETTLVPNSQITSLALILHEWATNSSKYGALSRGDGALKVTWAAKDHTIQITWTEDGRGEGIDASAAPGFGTRLVGTAARQLRGEASGGATEDGYVRCLTFEAAHDGDTIYTD